MKSRGLRARDSVRLALLWFFSRRVFGCLRFVLVCRVRGWSFLLPNIPPSPVPSTNTTMRHPDDSAGYGSESGESVLDMSIVGDEEEEARIRLESNLQDLSIQLSATNPSSYSSDHDGRQTQKSAQKRQTAAEENDSSCSEVEYPRHDPRPRETSIFQGYNSPSHIDNDYESYHYSYRSADDDDGIHHFAADTMSTAAHHTSALSLSAGLAGRGGRRAFDASGDWTPKPKRFSRKPSTLR